MCLLPVNVAPATDRYREEANTLAICNWHIESAAQLREEQRSWRGAGAGD